MARSITPRDGRIADIIRAMGRNKKPKKPPVSKASILERLARARAEQLAVRVRRWIPSADRVDGFVVDLGPDWVALVPLHGFILNGWCLLRVKDIQAVSIRPDPDALEVRVLKARGQWPPRVPDVQLDDLPSALCSAAAAASLITIHTEFDRPDACWIGSLLSVEGGMLSLLEVDDEGEWERKPRAFDLDDVTRIEFGGDYEEGLALAAGPAPLR